MAKFLKMKRLTTRINYYKKNKLYDKAIYIALFALQNLLSLREGVKGFNMRLEELIKLKEKDSQNKKLIK